MATNSLQTLISLLLLLTAAAAARSPKPSTTATSFSHVFNGDLPPDLILQGDANFPPGNARLRLTSTDDDNNPLLRSAGRVLYTKPIPFWDKKSKASFETTLKFIIVPSLWEPDSLTPADGLVFFVTALNSTVQESGGSLGVFDISGKNPSLFAVEFDSFVNKDFDPDYRHVGIDIQSQVSRNATRFDEIVGEYVTARIVYDAAAKLISVRGDAVGKEFEVSYAYDLSSFLPQQVQVGISAATGGSTAVHDLLSWSFSSTLVRKKHI